MFSSDTENVLYVLQSTILRIILEPAKIICDQMAIYSQNKRMGATDASSHTGSCNSDIG